MNIKELLNTLKDKNFRTSEAENPELVKMIAELEEMGLVRMMKSADDGTNFRRNYYGWFQQNCRTGTAEGLIVKNFSPLERTG